MGDEPIGKKLSCRFHRFGRAPRWIRGLQTREPHDSAVLERDVEPLVDADHAPCPGRRATVRMDEGAGPERQAGDYKTQCKPRARTHNLFAKAMRKAEIHANGFARSRRLRPAMAWAA